ncbi:hypothetical protein CW304_11040 [Bacillus sp. UFRGS-B20]|nr:hypothetical protein CW304_11040 [Bacillus sp. UFRGS-B20]
MAPCGLLLPIPCYLGAVLPLVRPIAPCSPVFLATPLSLADQLYPRLQLCSLSDISLSPVVLAHLFPPCIPCMRLYTLTYHQTVAPVFPSNPCTPISQFRPWYQLILSTWRTSWPSYTLLS